MKRITVLMRKAPYGSVYSAEGYRAIMGLGVFEMDVHVAFADDGVYALVKGQNPESLEMKPLGPGFAMLPEFEVDQFFVHAGSLRERGLTEEDLVVDVEVLDDEDFAELIESSQTVLPF
jgi:tRNA 2-thiouridine synthesizing protein C